MAEGKSPPRNSLRLFVTRRSEMRNYMTQNKLNELLGDMSLEEKIGQLVQVPGSCYEEDAVITGGMNNGWREETCRLAGSTLGLWGAEKLKKNSG